MKCGTRRHLQLASMMAALLLVSCAAARVPAAIAATHPAADPVSQEAITWSDLVRGTPAELTQNQRFAAPRRPRRPTEPFAGVLRLAGAEMGMSAGFSSTSVFGKDTTYFPNVSIPFFSAGTHLVPTSQDVIVNGTAPGTRSFWDVIVQPGRVWRQHGDRGWNRASFPFALVNQIEGETHNGVAMFVYKGTRVSHLRFQVVAQTSPYYVEDYPNAWGNTAASYAKGGIDRLEARRREFRSFRARRLPVAPFHRLRGKVGARLLASFDNTTDESLVVQSALVHRGVLYRTPCRTHAGRFPYCDEIRYGVWSVTKSAVMNVAMMRLARKYGVGLLRERVSDYVPELARPGWRRVTFLDLANMASGHGATVEDPTCYLCDYDRWYVAPSQAEKVAEGLDYPAVWAPGTRYNYRDQDAFLLGTALERYLQSRTGAGASLPRMLTREVYRPIGIASAPSNRTVERDGSRKHLMMIYGYYPTLDDLAKIALLYQRHGASGGRQILSRALVDRLLPKRTPPAGAIPKGTRNEFGRAHYFLNWHIEPFRSREGCTLHLPNMSGWGGNLVTLMPGKSVGMRIADAWTVPEGFGSTVSQARVADRLASFCP